MRFRSTLAASLIALAATAPNAAAQLCVGFSDVPDTSPFCPSVEWLKNRAITTGCTATEYCPGDSVSRLAMAAFMNRLGRALTPVVLYKSIQTSTPVTVSSPAGGVPLCVMDEDYAVTGFPRTARFNATVFAGAASPSWIVGWWRYSTDAGATWTNVPDTFFQRDWAGSGQVAGFAVMAPPMVLNVDTTYRFALFGSGLGSTYTFNPFGCQIEVVISNRNGTVSPFDE